ncbi:MAG: hypothetical protein HXS48_26090 [Theionarchaea archaeon]|nr:MAG: hypothetical protein AYK19_16040 [Theionarchaea archaeon DG-70-1]MBU7030430.1 hypothetical protein [Theionarchaea archaeon]
MKREPKKGHADTGTPLQDGTVDCPVCGNPLTKMNLVDMKSIVEDNLYFVGGVLIVGKVRLLCDFQHRYDEEEITLENPHALTALVDAEFDNKGECIHFDIMEVYS